MAITDTKESLQGCIPQIPMYNEDTVVVVFSGLGVKVACVCCNDTAALCTFLLPCLPHEMATHH